MFIEVNNQECDLIYNPFTRNKLIWSAIWIKKFCPVLTHYLVHDMDNFDKYIVI